MLKAGDAIDASIPMHEEGCMPQAAALRMNLRVPARNKWTEYLGRSSGGCGVESEISRAQPREKEGSPGPSDADSLVSNRYGPKTLLGTRMHHGRRGSLFVALTWASEIFWTPTRGSFGWRCQGYVCTAATFLPRILSRSSRPRSSSSRKASERLVGTPLLRATLTVSHLSREKPVWTGGESWSVSWSLGMTWLY